MSNGRYIDFDAMKEVPNKYDLRTSDIKKFRVLDWDKIKKHFWLNTAMKDGEWYCKLIGCQKAGLHIDDSEFWIGIDKKTGKVDYSFHAYSGMCHYIFDKFYQGEDIEDKCDMYVQVNALRFLNMLLDEKIVELCR